MKTKRTLGRREFLKKAMEAAATVAVCKGMTSAAARAETPAHSAGAIPTRTLGKTGLKLPILGYGGAALPKRWLNPLSQEDRVALVRYAYDRGLRWFDTAGNYFESQATLGSPARTVISGMAPPCRPRRNRQRAAGVTSARTSAAAYNRGVPAKS